MAERVLRLSIFGDTKALENALKRGMKSTEEFQGGMDRFKASLEAATPGSQALATGLGGLAAAVGGAIGFGVKLAADLEQAEIAFGTMLGSADAAKTMIAELQAFAAKTPFEFPEIQKGARNLLAFGVAADEIPNTLRRLGDVSAGVNMPLGELSEIFGKAKVQGRLFMEDINQLTGRGIPIIGELAKQFGVAESEIREMVSEGEVGFEHLNAAFTSMTAEGSKFGGMMEAQSQSLSGLFSTLKDSVAMSLASIGAEFIKATGLKDIVAGLSDAIGGLTSRIQASQEAGQTFTQAIVGLIPPETHQTIAVVAGAITVALIPAFIAAGKSIVAMTLPLAPFLIAGAALGALAYTIYENWEMLRPHLETFQTVAIAVAGAVGGAIVGAKYKLAAATLVAKGGLAGLVTTLQAYAVAKWAALAPMLPFIAAGAALAAAAYLIYSNWEPISEFFRVTWTALTEWLTTTWKGIQETAVAVWTGIGTFFHALWTELTTWLTQTWTSIKESAIAVWGAINVAITAALTMLRGVVTAVMSGVSGIWSSAWQGIRDFGAAVWEGLRERFTNMLNGIRDILGTTMAGIRGVWSAAWQGVSDLAGTLWGNIRTRFTTMIEGLRDIALGAVGIGRQVVESIWQGVTGLAGWIASAVANFVRASIIDPIKRALRIGSPSRVMVDMGEATVEGFAKGIADTASAMRGLTQKSMGGLVKGVPASAITVRPAAQGISYASAGGANTAIKATRDVTQTIIFQVDGQTLTRIVVKDMPSVLRLVGAHG